MSITHPHFQFPEDCLPLEAAIWWRDNSDLFLRCLMSPKFHKPWGNTTQTGNLIIYPPKCNIKEQILNGRKPKRPGSGSVDSVDKSTTFQWINVPLTDQDFDILEREETSLEQLALDYISLGVQRLGLSVKYDSARKSYSVSIYGSDMANNGKPCGISGAAADLRDALLVTLYRFHTCLQGSFDGKSNTDATIQSRRFR